MHQLAVTGQFASGACRTDENFFERKSGGDPLQSLATAASSGIVQMWHVETGRELILLDGMQRGVMEAAVFLGDSATLGEVKNGELHLLETGFRRGDSPRN